jgi:hypothetical protein
MHYKQDSAGYTIYSVGRNQRDDGGAVQEGEGDVGIRVPFKGNR